MRIETHRTPEDRSVKLQIEKWGKGFRANVVGKKGCWGYGETRDGAIRDVLVTYDSMERHGVLK